MYILMSQEKMFSHLFFCLEENSFYYNNLKIFITSKEQRLGSSHNYSADMHKTKFLIKLPHLLSE